MLELFIQAKRFRCILIFFRWSSLRYHVVLSHLRHSMNIIYYLTSDTTNL